MHDHHSAHHITHDAGCKMMWTHRSDDCSCERNLYLQIIVIASIAVIILGTASYISRSVALLGELMHMIIDSFDSIIALLVIFAIGMTKSATPHIRKIGALVAFLFLVCSIYGMFILGIEHIAHPPEIEEGWMIFGGIMGLGLNAYIFSLTNKTPFHHQSSTHAQVHVHAKGDVVMEFGVIVSGIIILATNWNIVDGIATLAIGLYLSYVILPLSAQRIYH